jgi:hypothetical protein
VGSWRGDFAWEILHRVRPEQLILIDPWRHHAEESYEWAMYGGRADGGQAEMDRVYDAVLDRFTKEIDNERVVVRRESSIEAATELADEYLDWVYIDGDHTYEAVCADLEAYWRVVKAGGILAGDDYGRAGWWANGVTKAVDHFSHARGLDLTVIGSQFLLTKHVTTEAR